MAVCTELYTEVVNIGFVWYGESYTLGRGPFVVDVCVSTEMIGYISDDPRFQRKYDTASYGNVE